MLTQAEWGEQTIASLDGQASSWPLMSTALDLH